MIPDEYSAAVAQGLREAFGATGFDQVRLLLKGHSALIFEITVQGRPLLLKVITRKNVMIGPARQYGCMRSAAEAGLAPRVHYTSVEDGISITDFIAAVAFSKSEALVRMPALLRALHRLPPFPKVESHFNTTCLFLAHEGTARDGLIQKFESANVLPKAEFDEILSCLAMLTEVCRPEEEDIVSSHNDLFKPDNILFDGNSVKLVDWEAAFLNDRYADLAVVANMFVSDDSEETLFLQAYFGQSASGYQRARFFLMRQLAHMFYAMVFLLQGPSPASARVEYNEFQKRFWSGEVQLTDTQNKALFGRVHLERLQENIRHERFREAVELIASRAR